MSTKLTRILSLFAAFFCMANLTNRAKAADLAVMNYDSGISADNRTSGGFTIGTRFSVDSSNVTINSLGFQFIDGTSYNVGLWEYQTDLTGTLLATATVSNTDTLYNGYRYATLASNVVLEAGKQYVIAGYLPNGTTFLDGDFSAQNNQPYSVTSGFTLTWAVYNVGASLQYPDAFNTGPEFGRWGPANAAFITPVPEPSTWALGGLSVLAMAAAARRRRRNMA